MSMPIDIAEKAGVRYLHFGSEWVQGAMRLRSPTALELAYTREMMAGLLLRDAHWPRKTLVIGLGAASLAKYLYHHCPQTVVRVVEIEPAVVAAARQFFHLPPQDRRFSIHIGDGVQYILEKEETFDLILVDGYDHRARAGALDTLPFYLAASTRLSEHGILATNLFGQSKGFDASVERIVTAFEGRALAFPSCDSGNVIAFAATGDPVSCTAAELRARAAQLKNETGLDLLPTVTRLEEAGHLAGGVFHL